MTSVGSLSKFQWEDQSTVIGTKFTDPSLQLSSLVRSPNATQQLKDLAHLVSHRGVVFFANQDLNIDDQKRLAILLGELTGKPETSTLHRHPISEESSELSGDVSVISSMGGIARAGIVPSIRASNWWHSDISFEPVPASYSILKMHTVPKVGGDTLFASAYEAYDKLSPAFAKFLEGMTAVHSGDIFADHAKAKGVPIQSPRGHPDNVGTGLSAVHPVIRTHPLTGFKALFVNKSFTTRIVELNQEESEDIINYLTRHVAENHDMQVRYQWQKNDVAIWDNRAVIHSPTHDYTGLRQGNRVVVIGEKPFFDPNSKSRRSVLGGNA